MRLKYFYELFQLKLSVVILSFAIFILSQSLVFAQRTAVSQKEQYRQLINSNTVNILGASLSGSYIKIIDDIAKAVNNGHNLRVIPIIGEGGSQNIRDILYLRGIDVGIVMSTSLEAYKKDPLFSNLKNNLHYIARLYDEEFHIIAAKNINSIEDLQDKVVGFHGGTYVSGQLLLDKLKIQRAKSIKIDFFDGLEMIKSGEISAIIRASASPMNGLNTSFDPKYHKLIPIKLNVSLANAYAPTSFDSKDYPNIIKSGEQVSTVAIGAILATFAHKPDTERYRRIAKFTEAFFNNFQKILDNKNRHKKWDEVNLAATFPGWTRFKAAQEWIDRMNYKSSQIELRFKEFIKDRAETLDQEQLETLFQSYLKWQGSNQRQ